jgi:hypothetical protein
MLAGAQVRCDRHLADVELQAAHHPAEAVDENRNLLEVEREAVRFDRAVFEGGVVALSAGDGFELQIWDGWRLPRLHNFDQADNVTAGAESISRFHATKTERGV